MEFLHKIKLFIEKNRLLSPSDKVVVGVSGGVDSMVLWDVLKKLGHKIFGVHVNYHLRAEDSGKDAELVKKILGKDVFVADVNPVVFEENKKHSVQEIARNIRFNELKRIRKEKNFDKIAVATHLNDNIETFFINFLRGGGISGLKGVLPENNRIVRPFLEITRKEIEQYAAENQIVFRHDKTNFEEKYLRNKIRLNIIPELEKIKPSFTGVAAENFNLLRTEYDFLEYCFEKEITPFITQEKELVKLHIAQLKKHPFGKFLLDKYLINKGFSKNQCTDIYQNFHQKGKTFVSRQYQLFFENENIIYLLPKNRKLKQPQLFIEETTLNEIEIKNKPPFTEYIDAGKIHGTLRLRKWKQGDYFVPLGMKGRKKISDFLTDNKIPAHEKENIYVVEDEKNIIWVVGQRISELYKISPETEKVLKLQVSWF